MAIAILELLARLPLRWWHRLGSFCGCCAYYGSPAYARQLRQFLEVSGVCTDDRGFRSVLKESVHESGKTGSEWIKVWFSPAAQLDALCVGCQGWESVAQARRRGKGVIFLLPHLGSFQMAMRYIAQRLPLTALYRPHRQKLLKPIQLAGAARANLAMAPTDRKGVEKLLRALRNGEAVTLPPDQAPNSRGGVWANFFGRPAYTMTLPRKLQQATGAAMFTAIALRLPNGGGFTLEFAEVPTEHFDEMLLNATLEQLIRRYPGQYVWGYNRYKVPRQAWPENAPDRSA